MKLKSICETAGLDDSECQSHERQKSKHNKCDWYMSAHYIILVTFLWSKIFQKLLENISHSQNSHFFGVPKSHSLNFFFEFVI